MAATKKATKATTKARKGATPPPAPVEVRRLNVRDISPAYYESVTLTDEQIPMRLHGCNRSAVAVAFKLAGGDTRPGRAKSSDAAWARVQIDAEGRVSVE
jgi:hypothetical protein